MKKIILMCPVIVALLLTMTFSGLVAGDTGLQLTPAEFKVENVPVGQKVEVPVKLNVTYQGPASVEYEIKSILPLSLREGYENIPAPSWLTFSPSEVTLEPGVTENITIYLNVPDKEDYLGKNWEVWIDVTPKPVYVGGGASVGAELFSRVLVSTSPVPPPPLLPILISVVVVVALTAGLTYAIKKKKI